MERPEKVHTEKPWGNMDQYSNNDTRPCSVKIIRVRKGESLSYQSHKDRDELWIMLDEGLKVELDDVTIDAKVDQEIWIPRGTKHGISADLYIRQEFVRFLEISYGHFDEADIIRYRDRYGREDK